MPKEVSNKNSEKNVKKNTPKKTLKQKTSNDTKNRRPQVGKLVNRYLQRIYDVTGVNPTKMVKGKDGKWQLKNEKIVRELLKKKFSHLDSHGVNKHIAAIFKEQYKTPDESVFKREFEPFGSNITNDISNLIVRFNTNVPFIKPNVIKSERKYNEFGIPLPIEIKYDYDDMRFDKYSGIKNDVRRYAVDIVNEVFKDVRGEQSDNMRTNIINSIHNIKLETDPNESREDIANRYKEAILKIVNGIIPYLYTLHMNDDGDVVKNQLNDLKQKLIDRIKNDDFDVDDDPIENYREAVEYGIGKMMSGKLTEDLKKDLDDIYTNIVFDENREYDEDTLNEIDQKLQHFFENIGLKQIDGIIVDRELRRYYHDTIPKLDEYLTKGYDKYRGKDKYKFAMIEYMNNKYIIDTDAVYNARNNTPDKEIDLLRDINKSIDAKGGLRDQIVNEAKKAFNETGQTTRKTDRKNIDQNMIANAIANKLDGVDDVDTIREVAKDVLYGIKEKAESHALKSLTDNTRAIMASNVVSGLFDSDEFRNPIKSIVKYAMKPIYIFEAIPPEERANKMLKEAADKHQDVIENVMMDSKEKEDKNELSELSKETIESIINKVIKQFNEEHQEEEEEHDKEDEEQLELSESSESSTIESVNEEEEEREEEDLEEEQGDDKNTSNEMSGISDNMIKEATTTLSERIAQSQQPSQTEIPKITLQDVMDAQNQSQSEDENPQLEPVELPPAPIQSDLTGANSMNQDRNDIGHQVALIEALNKYIPSLQYAQSSTDTNNILGGIVSIFKALPNGMDDEIANKLSEAVGPDGKKLFESKEEAARFIAKMRALNGNRLSSIKGGGQNHAIQLNITNQVVSNMPRKPYIEDTHPIPYQY